MGCHAHYGAYGYEATIQSPEIDFRLAPKSGHPRWNVCFSVEGMLDP